MLCGKCKYSVKERGLSGPIYRCTRYTEEITRVHKDGKEIITERDTVYKRMTGVRQCEHFIRREPNGN